MRGAFASARRLLGLIGRAARLRMGAGIARLHAQAALLCALANAAAAATPPGTTIANVAQVSYLVAGGVRAVGASNAASIQVLAPASAALSAAFNPDIVQPGGATVATLTIANTGGAPLANGRLVLTPPAGLAIAPRDPYTVLPNGAIEIRLGQPVPPGGALPVVVDAQALRSAPAGALQLGVDLYADALPPVHGAAAITVQRPFTPAKIELLAQDPTTGQLVVTNAYHAGQTVFVRVTDPDQNLDPYTAETVTVTLDVYATGDAETITLTETAPNSGVFVGSLPSAAQAQAMPNDGVLAVADNVEIRARYQDRFRQQDAVATAAMVDPFGLVFRSDTGQPVNGVRVTIVDARTGLPAQVFAPDGRTPYPATVTTGGSVRDAAGRTYAFGPGQYRFPYLKPGLYRFVVQPPAGYAFPTQKTDAFLQTLPGAPFALGVGSRGEAFRVSPGPAMHLDIPLDVQQGGLFVSKQAQQPAAGLGEAVPFAITVENASAAAAVNNAVLIDRLPRGFRYVRGSAKLDGRPIAPAISADGRTLKFALGTMGAAGSPSAKHQLWYLARIGPNAELGAATNAAWAAGTQLGLPVRSNVSQATVMVREDLMRSTGEIVGRVFVDEGGARAWGRATPGAGDDFNAPNEPGVPGVRVYLEDGRFATTDPYGFFHFRRVPLGSHVVQLDTESLPRGLTPAPMRSARFGGRAIQQIVEVGPGRVVRANFPVRIAKPPAAPVRLGHKLAPEDGAVWAELTVLRGAGVRLSEMALVYKPPAGWRIAPEATTLDGKPARPKREGGVWIVPLDPGKAEQRVRLKLIGGGDGGAKTAEAWVRYTNAAGRSEQTAHAANRVRDTVQRVPVRIARTLHLHFETRKADLNAERRAKLDALVEELRAIEGLTIKRIEVVGHTDNVPIAPEHRDEFADNQALSEARAKSVAEYLAQRLGLAPAQIGWRGMADRQPIASNATEAGRAQNRRTEIVIEGYRPKRVLETDLETVWADGQGEALGDWSVDGRPKPKYRPAPVPKAPDPTDLDAWFAQAPVGKAAWLYPTENARPAIPATHVLIAHPAGTTVELRLGDRAVSRLAFEGAKKRGLVAISHWRNVHLEEGENRFVAIVRDKQGREIARLVRTVEFAGEPVAARWLPERTKAAADGVSEPVIAVRFFDRRGRPAREGMVGEFTVDPPYRPADRMPEDGMPTPQAKGRFVIGKDGVALIALAPTTTPGEATLRFALADREETVRAWIEPAAREWILVGFAEGSVGYDRIRGAMQPIGQGRGERKIWKNGRAALYAKGRIQGKTLLTLAYDTAKTQGRNPTGHAGAIDPNRWYTVYGDASGQQFDAPSSHKLYLKLERDAFYALYGDFDTGLDHTELGRYARRLTGAKAALHGERAGFTAFATRTGRTKARDEIPGRGISGLYRLGQRNIVVGSERIWIETRDRLHPEHVLDRRLLSPHLDYDIDYLAGTVFFKQPVPAHDASLNPVFIVAEYETDGTTSQFTTAGGRAYLRAGEGGALEVGASAVQEGRPGKDDRLLGVDATYQPTPTLTLRAEAAQSETADFGRRRAWKVEGIVAQDAIRGRLYLRDVADGFGLGQVQGSENGARRAGLEGEWRINAHWRVRADLSATKLATTGAQRRMAAASVERREERWQARAGVRTVRDRLPQAAARRSDQLTAGATARVGERLTLGVDHEQTLNASRASSEFPTRTALRADWQLSPEAVLSLTEEWAYAAGTRVRTTRIGARTQLWEGAEMRSGYEHRLGEQGARAVANVGLQQRLHLDDAWALDLGFDRVKTLRGAHPRALNPNAPGVFGEGDYTVYSFGVGYTPEDWVANLRVDRRLGQNTRAWAGQASIQGRPLEALAAMGSLQFASEWGAGGVRNDQTLATLGAAWRPRADGWVWLVRLDLDWRRQRSAGVAHQRALRWIANLGANWRPAPDWELQLTLGGKRSDARFDALAISGYAGLASAELLYDLTDRWLLAMQGTGLWAAGMRRYSYGLGVDYALSEQLLVGLGFNADGFFDPDFVASRYTMRGVYLRMRAKFDQSDLAGMLKGF